MVLGRDFIDFAVQAILAFKLLDDGWSDECMTRADHRDSITFYSTSPSRYSKLVHENARGRQLVPGTFI